MTTIASMESFDSPMMDFTDDNTAMQIGSSNSWETLMDDDMAHFQTPQNVEIDMESYEDVENPEYEMTDEASVDQRNGDELQDVEVYDAAEEHHDYGSFHGDGAEMPDAMPLPQSVVDTPFMPEAYLEPEQITHEVHDGVSSHSAEPAAEPHIETSAEFVISFSESDQQALEPEPSVLHPTDSVHGDQHSQDQTAVQTEQDVPHDVPYSDHASTTEHEKASVDGWTEGQQHQTEAPNDVSAGESVGDPHEISEGIYIDPPPPVLLTLHPSSDTFCLFNYPTDEKSDSNLMLLLHDLPTLYYEPLSKVFEVLRNEGYITNTYDLSNGELVLDAYELVDLAISEDNVYAHEVSLHDLNVLHDISDLAGPLRIRLECRAPRFIVRYRYLRSELERLLAPSEDKSGESVTDGAVYQAGSSANLESSQQADWHEQHFEEHPSEQLEGTEEHHIEETDHGEHLDQGETLDHGEELEHDQQPERNEQSSHSDVPPLEQGHTNESDHNQDGAHDGELDPDADGDGDTDYGSQSAAEVVELHEHADTDAVAPGEVPSTEFQELEEQNEDYDERYGEDVPNEQEGVTVIIEGDLGDDHHEEWAAEPAQELPGADVGNVNEDEQVNEYSSAIDLTGEVNSEAALHDDNASASTEHAHPVDDNQETATNQNVTSAEHRAIDPYGGDLERDPQFDPDTDNLDDIHWDEDNLGNDLEELDDPEDGQNVDSPAADSVSSKTLSSKTASSKRSFDELDLDEVQEVSNPLELSPDPKRQKVRGL